jgi:hypothetical protein
MSRIVTGLFYERTQADSAIALLKERGIPGENLILETEVPSTFREDQKFGRLEKERRYAWLEVGLIIGLVMGLLSGWAIGILAEAMAGLMKQVDETARLSPWMTNLLLTVPLGGVIGVLVGGTIGWVVDHTLNRMGAGPPVPTHEALVTVYCDESQLSQVEETLIQAGACHLHRSEQTFTGLTLVG